MYNSTTLTHFSFHELTVLSSIVYSSSSSSGGGSYSRSRNTSSSSSRRRHEVRLQNQVQARTGRRH
jgi:hypothetical protein